MILFSLVTIPAAIVVLAGADDSARPRAGENTGRVEGRITYRGKIPRHEVSDMAGNNAELFTVHAGHRGLRDVVVFLDPRGEKAEARQKSDGAATSERALPSGDRELPEIVIDQKDYVFVPHLIAVRAGQPVRFTSTDVANHNVRTIAFEQKNQFNKFTGGGDAYTHRFVTERKNRPVRIGCDLHRWMGAWIFVFDHPRFAVTGEEGKYRIGDIPPGRYVLSIRQPDGGLKADREIEVAAGKAVTIDVEFTEKDLRLE